jgi:hypothetical protein
MDYEILLTSDFIVREPDRQLVRALSTNGTINFEFMAIKRTIDGEYFGMAYLICVSGNRDTLYFINDDRRTYFPHIPAAGVAFRLADFDGHTLTYNPEALNFSLEIWLGDREKPSGSERVNHFGRMTNFDIFEIDRLHYVEIYYFDDTRTTTIVIPEVISNVQEFESLFKWIADGENDFAELGIAVNEIDEPEQNETGTTNDVSDEADEVEVLPLPDIADDTNEITVTLNGTPIEFDVAPIIIDNHTLVPMRKIFEALEMTVDWDGETQTITAQRGFWTYTLQIGGYEIRYSHPQGGVDYGPAPQVVIGGTIRLDVPPMIVDNRTLVPVRAIAEATGANVDWDFDTQTVIITN